jgi:hypothetical protein
MFDYAAAGFVDLGGRRVGRFPLFRPDCTRPSTPIADGRTPDPLGVT